MPQSLAMGWDMHRPEPILTLIRGWQLKSRMEMGMVHEESLTTY